MSFNKYDSEIEHLRQQLEKDRLRDEKLEKYRPIAEFIYGALITLLLIGVIKWLWQ